MTNDFGRDDIENDEIDENDQQVERLADEIEATREDLTITVEAIGDKLEPANLAREATESARNMTLGKVDQMSIGMQETWRDIRTGNSNGILETVKSNPVPAAMVGLGLGLLFMNRGAQAQRSFRGGSNYTGGYGLTGYGASGYGGQAGYGGDPAYAGAGTDAWSGQSGGGVTSKIGDTADQAGATIGRFTDQAGETVGRVADQVGETAGQLPQQAGQFIDQGTGQVRRLIDENPLAAGVVAIAAGAAIGMLVPTTSVERQAIGTKRDQLVGQAESTVNEALDKVDQGSHSGSTDRLEAI
jgi:Protein of unknown function (DUF3618)